MDTRKVATEYRMAQWGQAMQERVANGESIDAFCQKKGISKNIYFYWQRKMRAALCQNLLPAAEEMTVRGPAPEGWAVCESAEVGKAKERAVTVEIGKYRVRVEESTDLELFSKVCRVLVAIC